MVEAIDRIGRYTAGMDLAAFAAHGMAQDAVIRNLEIIGEACRNIERAQPDFAERHPSLPLGAAYEMRNVLAHGYFKVDLGIVWNTVQRDLPGLRSAMATILAQSPSPPPSAA